ncbi:MAG: phage virion morphogenesis protein [Bacteroidales bacterium]|nr:phage virion morphogenesis protein [Bacteroidales bacterium]
MRDLQNMPGDFRRKHAQIEQLVKKLPKFVAGAAEKMKDANFSAQGFISNGSATKWPKRKKETAKTAGKRILHQTGLLQNSVKAHPLADHVRVGVDLGKVPYAKIHNEGGNVVQHIKPHHRKHPKSGKRYQVKAFARKVRYPQRKYLGFSPDIIKATDRELKYQLDKIMKS